MPAAATIEYFQPRSDAREIEALVREGAPTLDIADRCPDVTRRLRNEH